MAMSQWRRPAGETVTRRAASVVLALCFVACGWIAGCAAPGDPVARHPVVPAAVADLAVRQYGSAFALTFTLPKRSVDREALAEQPSIEIYRAAVPPGSVPDKKTSWQLAYTIPSEQVDRYLTGERIEFHDALAAGDFALPAGSSMAYKIRTRAARARASADSNVVTKRILAPPEAPREVRVEVSETALIVHWAEVAAPSGSASIAYRVYRAVAESGQDASVSSASQAKLKTQPELAGSSTSTEFREAHFEFGTAYLYSVRSVAQYGADVVESADSAAVAITPRDTFPPAAPNNVEISVVPATPQAGMYVELSWAISSEADLAGYIVYRSDAENAPGERISTETLPSPTFRDMSVVPGGRYFYRVSAVDRSGNESPRSSAVEADIP
jgi:hypothetical protein